MSEATDSRPAPAQGATAGALLKQARQARGLHIAALAVAIKVAQRKLELLEADRYDELPDATFTRALAQTVCRTLKIDPAPVLALLPQAGGYRLEQLGEGLNAPYRERPGRTEPSDWSALASPTVWGPALVLLAAAMVYLFPSGWIKPSPGGPRAASAPVVLAPAASAAVVSLVVDSPAASPPASPPAGGEALFPPPETAASAAGQTTPFAQVGGILQVHATAESWLEVLDGRGQTLMSRLVQPGEAVGLDGVTPLKVRIGNAAVTQLVFRGKEMSLSSFTRDNIARLELK